MLNADILFNIGHTIALEKFGNKVFMINAFDDISFDEVAIKCANTLKWKFKNISVVTDSQHIHQVSRVKEIFEERGFSVVIGKGKGQLNDAQIFGCEFYPVHNIANKIELLSFLDKADFILLE